MLAGFLLFSCGPQENPSSENNAPEISTGHVTEITTTTASCPCNVTSDGGAPVTARGLCWNTTQNPTIADAKTTDGGGTGTFTGHMTGLTSNTTYYVRAYATNSVGTSYGEQRSFKTNQGELGVTFTDARDGNTYCSVQIGNQTWMGENLRYSAGQSIGHWYRGQAVADTLLFGRLYSFAEVLGGAQPNEQGGADNRIRGICPTGWHLPSQEEWRILLSLIHISEPTRPY